MKEGSVYLQEFEDTLRRDQDGNYIVTDSELLTLLTGAEKYHDLGVSMQDLIDGKCADNWATGLGMHMTRMKLVGLIFSKKRFRRVCFAQTSILLNFSKNILRAQIAN